MTPEQKERDDIAKHVAGHVYRALTSETPIGVSLPDDWAKSVASDCYELADALIARGRQLRAENLMESGELQKLEAELLDGIPDSLREARVILRIKEIRGLLTRRPETGILS